MTQREEARRRGRQLVLRAALDEFLDEGFGGATTRSIAARAGVAQSTLFHHFRHKHEIHDALVEHASARFRLAIGPSPEVSDDAFGTVASLVDDVVALLAEPASAKLFLFMSRAQSRGDTNVSASADRLVADVAGLLEQGQDAGRVRPGDPLALSLALCGALQGVAEMRVSSPHLPLPESSWLLDIVAC